LLRPREAFFSERFAARHHRKDDPGKLAGERHRDEPRRLFRTKRGAPLGEPALAL
jgi:hypothetical protein